MIRCEGKMNREASKIPTFRPYGAGYSGLFVRFNRKSEEKQFY